MTKDEQLAILGTLDKLPLNEAKTKALEILTTFPTNHKQIIVGRML